MEDTKYCISCGIELFDGRVLSNTLLFPEDSKFFGQAQCVKCEQTGLSDRPRKILTFRQSIDLSLKKWRILNRRWTTVNGYMYISEKHPDLLELTHKCGLCEKYLRVLMADIDKDNCRFCPLFQLTGKSCSNYSSNYIKWVTNEGKWNGKTASYKMLCDLKKIKQLGVKRIQEIFDKRELEKRVKKYSK